jgi:7-keto-8-aminopelargonate synthetase-like enzyme
MNGHDLKAELAKLSQIEAASQLVPVERIGSGRARYNHQNEVVDFSSWDVLGLADNRALKKKFHQALEQFACAPYSPRTRSGTSQAHIDLEFKAAKFFGFSASLFLSSRTQAILTIFSVILRSGDVLFLQSGSDSCAIDAAYLCEVDIIYFNKISDLEDLLNKNQNFTKKRKFIFCESLNHIDGSRLDLLNLYKLVSKYALNLILDESYTVGYLGGRGVGLVEESLLRRDFNSIDFVLAIVVDLGYTLSHFGALILTSNELKELIVARSSSLARDPSPLPYQANFALQILESVELMHGERTKLTTKIIQVKNRINDLIVANNFSSFSYPSPIFSIKFKNYQQASAAKKSLLNRKILVDVIPSAEDLSPSAYLRFIIGIAHSQADLELLYRSLSEIIPTVQVDGAS